MNIFYLHPVPATCARLHCDKHVVKMILEYSQLLSTAHHLGGSPAEITDRIYKPTHANHPSAVWVRECAQNYHWLFELLTALHMEYTYRYGKTHAAYELLSVLVVKPSLLHYSDKLSFCPPPLAMPPACKVLVKSLLDTHDIVGKFFGEIVPYSFLVDCRNTRASEQMIETVYAYRTYYVTHKAHILDYTGRSVPNFCKNVARFHSGRIGDVVAGKVAPSNATTPMPASYVISREEA